MIQRALCLLLTPLGNIGQSLAGGKPVMPTWEIDKSRVVLACALCCKQYTK